MFKTVSLFVTLFFINGFLCCVYSEELKIPFVKLGSQSQGIELTIESDKPHNIFVHLPSGKKVAFQNNMPVKVLEYTGGSFIIFTRPLLKKGFNVFQLNSEGELEELEISESLKSEGYFRQAVVVGRDIYFVHYIPKESFDSKEGDINELCRLKSDIRGHLSQDLEFNKNINRDKDIRYGIDRTIHIVPTNQEKQIVICSGPQCQNLDLSSENLSTLGLPHGYSILELQNKHERLVALLVKSTIKKTTYIIYDIQQQKIVKEIKKGVPFNLRISNDQKIKVDILTNKNKEAFICHLIANSKDSGLLELGMGNDQARIAWSSVYYLNAFIDVVVFPKYFKFLSDKFRQLMKERLKVEMMLLDHLFDDGVVGMETTRYSTRKQPRIYAVQTGRVLRLLKRYVYNFSPLSCFELFQNQTESLDLHEEVFHISDEKDIDSIENSRISLMWPRGVDFPFDGFKIPFNHQDDWVAGVSYGLNTRKARESQNIVLTLLEHSGIVEATIKNFEWAYWYGRVRKPWQECDDLSVNTPEYYGDLTLADISYRVIDVMALLTVAKMDRKLLTNEMLDKIVEATRKGLLFPFVQEDLKDFYGIDLALNKNAALYYLNCDAVWGLQNAFWALKDYSSVQHKASR